MMTRTGRADGRMSAQLGQRVPGAGGGSDITQPWQTALHRSVTFPLFRYLVKQVPECEPFVFFRDVVYLIKGRPLPIFPARVRACA